MNNTLPSGFDESICENICEPKGIDKCLCEGGDSSQGLDSEGSRTWEWTSSCACGTGSKGKNCRCKFTIKCRCGAGGGVGDCCGAEEASEKEIYTCECQCGSGTCQFKIRKCRCCEVIKTQLGLNSGSSDDGQSD